MARILVVDDAPEILQYMAVSLNAAHHEVMTANNGQEACEVARREHPDLIFMDLMMPVMNGMDAARSLKEDQETSGIPIVAVSAYTLTEEYKKYFNLSMPKPCRFVDIIQIVDTICRQLVGKAAN